MRTSLASAIALSLVLAAGCGKKKDDAGGGKPPASKTAPAGTGAAGSGSAAAAGSGSAAAAGSGSAEAAGSGSAAAAGSGAAAAAPAGKCGAQPCPCKEGSQTKTGATPTTPDDWNICELSAETPIQGLTCAPGRVVFNDDGSLAECMLAADGKVGDYMCKGQPNSVSLYPGGKLSHCSSGEDVEIGGYKIAAYQNLSLFEDGTIHEAWLKGETRDIGGVPCTGGLRFFRGGKLETCSLGSATEIAGNKLPADTMVVFRDDGSVRGLYSEKPLTWDKKKFDMKAHGHWLCFADGKPDPAASDCSYF